MRSEEYNLRRKRGEGNRTLSYHSSDEARSPRYHSSATCVLPCVQWKARWRSRWRSRMLGKVNPLGGLGDKKTCERIGAFVKESTYSFTKHIREENHRERMCVSLCEILLGVYCISVSPILQYLHSLRSTHIYFLSLISQYGEMSFLHVSEYIK